MKVYNWLKYTALTNDQVPNARLFREIRHGRLSFRLSSSNGFRQMSITLLHTADWQLGKRFGSIEGDSAAILREERFEAVKRIARLAGDREVDAILVAGDVFDGATTADQTLRRALEAMSVYEGPWVLLPGNHDPALSESPWTRLNAIGRPENVIPALACEPILFADGRLAVLPAPLTRKNEPDDVTRWMDSVETLPDAVRVGMAHGSMANRIPEGDARNEIAEDRTITAKLDYLALGDWHGTVEIAPKTWYSGTPEPDRFPRNDPGNVLLVTIDGPGSSPTVEKVTTGCFQWRMCEVACGVGGEEDTVDAVEAAIETAAEMPETTLLHLTLTGTTDLAGRRRIDDYLDSWEARLRYLHRDLERLVDEPSADDLDAIDKSGFVRAAVDGLKAKADDLADPDHAVARTALRILYQ